MCTTWTGYLVRRKVLLGKSLQTRTFQGHYSANVGNVTSIGVAALSNSWYCTVLRLCTLRATPPLQLQLGYEQYITTSITNLSNINNNFDFSFIFDKIARNRSISVAMHSIAPKNAGCLRLRRPHEMRCSNPSSP